MSRIYRSLVAGWSLMPITDLHLDYVQSSSLFRIACRQSPPPARSEAGLSVDKWKNALPESKHRAPERPLFYGQQFLPKFSLRGEVTLYLTSYQVSSYSNCLSDFLLANKVLLGGNINLITLAGYLLRSVCLNWQSLKKKQINLTHIL